MVLVIYISLLCFTSYFFYQKPEDNRLKKASWRKWCGIIFLFLLKIGSVGPVDQQVNLVSPNNQILVIASEKLESLIKLQAETMTNWYTFCNKPKLSNCKTVFFCSFGFLVCFNWASFYARLNNRRESWSYKKKKQKKIQEIYLEKNLQMKDVS